MRWPKKPATQTTTLSPGSTRLTKQVSMPAMPVALAGKVNWSAVRRAARSRPCVSSMMARNSGSRWPTSGVAIAVRTRGWTSLGPGPSSTRRDTFSCPTSGKAVSPGCGSKGFHPLLDELADGLEAGVVGAGEPLEDAGLASREDGAGLFESPQG